MAKAGQLAGLAALGALAYMNRDKLGMGDKVDLTQPSGDSNPTRGAGYQSTETRLESPEDTIKRSMKKAPLDETQMYPSGVMGGARMADDVKPTPVAPRNTIAASNLPPARPTPVVGGDENYGNEGRGSKSPALMAMNEANGADTRSANRGDQLASVSRAVKRESNKKQFAEDVPYQLSAQKTDAMAVASRAARAADAKRRAAKQSAYKAGGVVSKVSSASKRADGIATKGKTRGKMY